MKEESHRVSEVCEKSVDKTTHRTTSIGSGYRADSGSTTFRLRGDGSLLQRGNVPESRYSVAFSAATESATFWRMAVPRSGFRNASVSAHTAVLNSIRPLLRSTGQPNPSLERTGAASGRPDRALVGAG